jgi:PAS domain-containing protein
VADALVHGLALGVLVSDVNGCVVYANPAARRLEAASIAPLRWAITQAILTEDDVRQEPIAVDLAGEPRRWVSFVVTPARDARYRVTGAIATVADVTAERQASAWGPVMESLMRL